MHQILVEKTEYSRNNFESIFEPWFSLSVEGELDKLAAQRGLGDARHRRDLRELITLTKIGIAEAIYLLSHLDHFRYIL